MTDGLGTFKYEPIDSKARQIRVLTILPPQPNSSNLQVEGKNTIECILKTVNLDDMPVYDALSYRWGPTEPAATITISGSPITTTPNLHTALLQLRADKHSPPIWIDAVCINQTDTTEKNLQIPLMEPIYSGATSVIVWLGPAADESDILMDAFADVGERAFNAGILDINNEMRTVMFDPNPDERRAAIEEPIRELSEAVEFSFPFQARKAFTEREYWRRVWIVQEIVLPKKLIIVCGMKRIPYHCLAAGNLFCDIHSVLLTKKITQIPMDELMNAETGTPTPLYNKVMAFLQCGVNSALAYLVGVRKTYQKTLASPGTPSKDTLFQLLSRGCIVKSSIDQREATNPKDMIYGLLGLASDASILKPYIDYSPQMTIEKLYTTTTRLLLEHGNRDVLAWNQQGKKIAGLPSWVPDFSSVIREPCCLSQGGPKLFCASGPIGEDNQFRPGEIDPEKPSCLAVKGFQIDTIRTLGAPWDPPLDTPFDPAAISAYFKSIISLCMESSTLPNPMRPNATYHIACADQAHDPRGDRVRSKPEEARQGWEDVLRRMSQPAMHSESGGRFQRVVERLHARRVVLGESGRVGLGPEGTREADSVVVLKGCEVPFVLRRREGEDSGWELVGEAYVYGVMDGEAMALGLEEELFVLS